MLDHFFDLEAQSTLNLVNETRLEMKSIREELKRKRELRKLLRAEMVRKIERCFKSYLANRPAKKSEEGKNIPCRFEVHMAELLASIERSISLISSIPLLSAPKLMPY